MDGEGVDGQRGLLLREPLEVDVGDHEARRAAVGVLEDPVEVAPDRDRRPRQAVEDRDPLRLLDLEAAHVVGLRHLLEKRGEEGDEPGHRVRALEIRHRPAGSLLLRVPCRRRRRRWLSLVMILAGVREAHGVLLLFFFWN